MNPVLPQLGIPPIGMNMGLQLIPQPMRQIQTYQKFDFPMEIQCYFKMKNIGFVKPVPKPKCRKFDPVCKYFPNILDKFESTPPPKRIPAETKLDKLNQWKQQKKDQNRLKNKENLKFWNPFEDQNIQSDPYKTIIVSRLSYETTEKKLKKEFDIYGTIKFLKIIRDKLEKSRGYAFIEFEHKRDFTTAYKNADGKKIDGRRVCVDFERGRTVHKFRPRRLGGGLGDTRIVKLPNSDLVEEDHKQGRERRSPVRGDSGSHSRKNREQTQKLRSRSRSKSKQKRIGRHPGSHSPSHASKSRSHSGDDKRGDKKKDQDRMRRHDKKKRSHSNHNNQVSNNNPQQDIQFQKSGYLYGNEGANDNYKDYNRQQKNKDRDSKKDRDNNGKDHKRDKRDNDKGGNRDYGGYSQQQQKPHHNIQENSGDYQSYQMQQPQQWGGQRSSNNNNNMQQEEDRRAMFGMDESRYEAMQQQQYTQQKEEPHSHYQYDEGKSKKKKNKKDKDKKQRSYSRD